MKTPTWHSIGTSFSPSLGDVLRMRKEEMSLTAGYGHIVQYKKKPKPLKVVASKPGWVMLA